MTNRGGVGILDQTNFICLSADILIKIWQNLYFIPFLSFGLKYLWKIFFNQGERPGGGKAEAIGGVQSNIRSAGRGGDDDDDDEDVDDDDNDDDDDDDFHQLVRGNAAQMDDDEDDDNDNDEDVDHKSWWWCWW